MVEKLFIFKVDVLSMVLYRRRSFETTVKIRQITGSRRLKSNSESRELLTPGIINWQELIKRLHTYTETKHQIRANKFQGKTYQANSPTTQEHKPWAPRYRLPKVTPKPQTSHNSLLDTSLHSREKKSSSTHQNTDTSFPNQETLTSHLYKLTHSEETPQ